MRTRLPVRDDFRDYAYVSARKVVRMGKTLRPKRWARIQDVRLNVGPVGAGMTFDTSARAADVIVLVPEVERAIRDEFGIRDLADPQLRAGHWFRVSGIPMTYGIPDPGIGGVLFLGSGGRRFALGGSAEYLLDRGATGARDNSARYPGSLPHGVHAMLRSLAGESLSDEDGSLDGPGGFESGTQQGRFGDVNFDHLARLFIPGREPMEALARCFDIVTDGEQATVIGSPLYVAFQPPP